MAWDYRCLNCKAAYRVLQRSDKIRCPRCKGERARWIPGGIAIRKVATGIDRDVRSLAAQFGMTDIKPATRAGDTRARAPDPPRTIDWGPQKGSLGTVKLPYDQNGQFGSKNLPFNGAVCAPTAQATFGAVINPEADKALPNAKERMSELKKMTQTIYRHKSP